MPRNCESIEPYMRNITLYEKIFGLLYLQPLFLCRLLVCESFGDSEKIFKLIKDLYVRSSAVESKNVSYLMSILVTLIDTEKKKILELKLGSAAFDLYSLKIYMLICNTNPTISGYFDTLKEKILRKIVEIFKSKRFASKSQDVESVDVGISYIARHEFA